MADDQSYMSFLEKANQPLTGYSNASTADSPDKKKLKTMDTGAKVPEVIIKVVEKEDVVYVSDADEPFEGVALKWEHVDMPTGGKCCRLYSRRGLEDEVNTVIESFAGLINHPTPLSAGITTMSVEDWNKTGGYTQVVDAVKQAANGEKVMVYVVPRTEVKTEYWVVAMDKKEKRLVGAKALGVES